MTDDEDSGFNEAFIFDFDAPDSTNGFSGGSSLGNDVETTFGGGDSGGPSFFFTNNSYYLAGVNTFSVQVEGGPDAPLFGSGGGGILVYPYIDWIESVTSPVPEPATLILLFSGLIGLAGVRK